MKNVSMVKNLELHLERVALEVSPVAHPERIVFHALLPKKPNRFFLQSKYRKHECFELFGSLFQKSTPCLFTPIPC